MAKIKRVLSIFGTRAAAINMAPVVIELEKHRELESFVCSTGQHRQLLDQVLQLFEIKPTFDLNLMKPGRSLQGLAADILYGLRSVFQEVQPDLVLVEGDSITTVSSALASYYHRVPVAHIGAGLRSGNLDSSWPDEGNRRVVSSLSNLHLAPTLSARDNLIREGTPAKNILITGNPAIDSLLQIKSMLKKGSKVYDTMQLLYPELDQFRGMILLTCNHVENFKNGYDGLCNMIGRLSESFPDVDIVFPSFIEADKLERVSKILSSFSNVYFKKAQDYLPFIYLMERSHLIITDSGGVQDEAPALGKPVLLLGDHCEREEAINMGTAKVVGTEPGPIIEAVGQLFSNTETYQAMSKVHFPYGDGTAAKQIVEGIAAADI